MSEKLTKFKNLLQSMFEMDKADLDFGIYRIMNQKRNEINNFLDEELLVEVRDELSNLENKDISGKKQELEKLKANIEDAGMKAEDSPKYQALKAEVEGSVDVSALENEIFSSLTSFFRRYYKEGDFISKRRYKEGVYAIPYEGEEVKLHWANADQYYIKSSENFREYAFKLDNGKTVCFKLVEASTEKNNNKSQDGERRFILNEDKQIEVVDNTLHIYLNFELMPKSTKQDKLNEETEENIQKLITGSQDYKDFLQLFANRPSSKNKKRTLLGKQLADYTSKNTFDYFIHKDLGSFLRRELDFFIKNEVMFLDNIEDDEQKVIKSISKVKVIRKIGNKIIKFLEQLENFQKKLWEKKKFVVDTNYCITLDRINEKFYPEILRNKEQIEEWKNLFAIDEIKEFNDDIGVDFLINNKYLILDTKFFDYSFKEKLISELDSLDDNTDGLLIHSDNFQALNLLQKKYWQQVECVYADPPYNAKSSEILYKNSFKHSSWISLMFDRIKLAGNLKSRNGSIITAVDENEFINLLKTFETLYPEFERNCISIIHNPAGVQGDNFSYSHEYAIFVFEKLKNLIGKTDRKEESEEAFRDWGGTCARSLAKNCFYPIFVKDGDIVGFGDVCPDDFHPQSSNIIKGDIVEVYPIGDDGEERKWVFARDSVETIKNELIVKEKNGLFSISRVKTKTSYKTVWADKKYYANIYGSKLLNNIMGTKKFDFPKSLYTVQDCLYAVNSFRDKKAHALDFFAGSGTTGHAVVNLNREDDGARKYTLIEMGEYFNAVTKPRIQKIVYSKDWKKGKPVDRNGISHMFKYITLESYEDTLNNLKIESEFEKIIGQTNKQFKEDYMLSYMLEVETRESNSLLNIDLFNNPFGYTLNIEKNMETKKVNVDLVETFNYLIGLTVNKIEKTAKFSATENSNAEKPGAVMIEQDDNGDYLFKEVEGTLPSGEKVLIIWRNLTGNIVKDNAALDAYFLKKRYNTLDREYDFIYVNGGNNLPNLRASEDKWKVIMIEEEFKKRMFEEKGL